jgi:SRSO17 transposase
MGDVQIVFSRKADDEKSLMKYIATDMLSLTTYQILTIYSYRWQIELFFKELKSYLGLGDYQVLSFRSIVRHIDTVIMAFMYLEHLRLCKLKENPKDKHWLYARTLQMSYVLQHEVRMTNLGFIKRIIKNEGNLDKLERELLEKTPLVA